MLILLLLVLLLLLLLALVLQLLLLQLLLPLPLLQLLSLPLPGHIVLDRSAHLAAGIHAPLMVLQQVARHHAPACAGASVTHQP